MNLADSIAQCVLTRYDRLPRSCKPLRRANGKEEWTVLAGIVLRKDEQLLCISLGTGVRCLPHEQLPKHGDILHDCHAEVLAKRGFRRWLYTQLESIQHSPEHAWFSACGSGRWRMHSNVKVHLYISTLPCGDASMTASALLQDPQTALIMATTGRPGIAKDWSSLHSAEEPNGLLRGRTQFNARGLRTKPGRLDAPSTSCMSCSDKIASWICTGLQGALLSRFFEPIYLSSIVIGETAQIAALGNPDSLEAMMADCQSAFNARTAIHRQLADLYDATVAFCSITYDRSRLQLKSSMSAEDIVPATEATSWIEGSEPEALYAGCRRGARPDREHALAHKKRSRLCKVSFLEAYCKLTEESSVEYHQAKQSSHAGTMAYRHAKECLRTGPFSAWLVTSEATGRFRLPPGGNNDT
ncbi:uncharacterized protein L969DRAFT_102688 [Mixia osmundae IAM 14324]|uniref:A to I editase domain-containing protein n=1 Tax=Mixia osmundae (strain CBS 9802 / IAM 14324 / JCM 22182 / KY 12970) TaxID=764103 RepID=G7E9J9_MIXOS|nr:uncharacterized protein L969DRAFT_102688 [Mixia osmundae IAM 14324]KEI39950.1 hypothetical protein L969DRAFT_102688 [Mixia osmundae IAM 14324]GAA99318.1 hypothetical protein E5Q_06013 [Mixia osmundae IAM 14324]